MRVMKPWCLLVVREFADPFSIAEHVCLRIRILRPWFRLILHLLAVHWAYITGLSYWHLLLQATSLLLVTKVVWDAIGGTDAVSKLCKARLLDIKFSSVGLSRCLHFCLLVWSALSWLWSSFRHYDEIKLFWINCGTYLSITLIKRLSRIQISWAVTTR